MNKIGLIAGNGRFPLLFAEEAKKAGARVIAVAHRGETDPMIERVADEVTWIRVGQLGRLIRALKSAGVTEAVMAGGIKKTRIFEARPDLRALKILARSKQGKDDALLRAVAEELEREKIRIRESTLYLSRLLADPGEMTRPLTREEREDVRFGWRLAKEVGLLDIGQCVVVKSGIVLAVEAVDGTDATIQRGGALSGGGAVVVKVFKPKQDFRFDIPAVGPGTIAVMREAKASVLAVEAQKTLLLDKGELLEAARQAGIAVVGWSNGK
jgi:DUF1009 family protein